MQSERMQAWKTNVHMDRIGFGIECPREEKNTVCVQCRLETAEGEAQAEAHAEGEAQAQAQAAYAGAVV